MKSHNNQKNQKKLGSRPSDVAKNATTQTFDIVDDEVTLTMNVANSNKMELFSFDLYDNFLNEYWEMNLSREKLKGMAEFILKYLENN